MAIGDAAGDHHQPVVELADRANERERIEPSCLPTGAGREATSASTSVPTACQGATVGAGEPTLVITISGR
jgi:hypothetical protein